MMNGGGMGTLSPALSGRLQSAIAGGLFPATALDPKILGDLGALPEHMASVVLDRFLSSNMANVRNPSAFLVGVMNRYKSEVQAGGVAIPPAPPPQLLGLAAAGGDAAAAALQSQVAPDAAAAAAAGLAAAGFAPASVLGAPAMGFGAFEGAAALMGAQSVTSTGVPQNTNPLLAPSKTIHVGNLNAAVTPDVLRQIFSCIGSVVDVRVAGDGRYGFVDFADADAATASVAMHGTLVCGTSIRVEKAMQPRLFAQSNQPTPLPPVGAANPAAALLAFQATQASALNKPSVPEFSGLAGVTSPAVLAALARQVEGAGGAPPVTAEADPNFAFLNPAQQRAALEAKHREKLTGAKNISGWGVAKRRDSDSDDDSRDRRRRRGRDRDRGRSDRRRRRDRGDSRSRSRSRGRRRRRSRSRSRSSSRRRRRSRSPKKRRSPSPDAPKPADAPKPGGDAGPAADPPKEEPAEAPAGAPAPAEPAPGDAEHESVAL